MTMEARILAVVAQRQATGRTSAGLFSMPSVSSKMLARSHNDVYVVQYQLTWSDWQDTSDHVDCAHNPLCSITVLKNIAKCKTWNSDIKLEAGLEGKSISIGLSRTNS